MSFSLFDCGVQFRQEIPLQDPMAAKGLLRQSSVNTTLTHYIKDVPAVTENAMIQVEQLFTQLDGVRIQ